MATYLSRRQRLIPAFLILPISLLCLQAMDIPKMVAHHKPFVESNTVPSQDGIGTVALPSTFFGIETIDKFWRDVVVAFTPSAIGYDPVASWQMFAFLTDLGPLYAIWILESCRATNTYSPQYLSTVFAFAGQFYGLGSIAPIYYTLSIIFGPTASQLAQSTPAQKNVSSSWCPYLLPIILLFHTSEVFGAYTSSTPETRLYWAWAWQMSPLWIGLANWATATFFSRGVIAKRGIVPSPTTVLGVLGLISAGTWLYTLIFSPFPPTVLFFPVWAIQDEFVPHMHRSMQFDMICIFGSTYLWMVYAFFDLHSAGLMANSWWYPVAVLPAVSAIFGPGVAFAVGWLWRESYFS